MTDVVSVEDELAGLINQSGKLRMLSHQVVMLLLLRNVDAGCELARKKLAAGLAEFNKIAAKLRTPGPGTGLSPEAALALTEAKALTPVLLAPMERFQNQAQQLINQSAPPAEDVAALGTLVATDLLAALNEITDGVSRALAQTTEARREEQAPLARAVSRSVNEVARMSQTLQIVSMNASLEAQRAGQAGAAFGTIATEMRGLAVRAREGLNRLTEDIQAVQDHGGAA